MDFNERLRTLRIQAGITQQQLSDMVDTSVVTVRNWESGAKQPSMRAIIALSHALNTSSDTILGIRADDLIAKTPCTKEEVELLSQYRTLDIHGRYIVDTICGIEAQRVEEERRNRVIDFMYEKSRRSIPKYTVPSAAGYSAPVDNYDYEMILADNNAPKDADFAVRIQGNSMEPYICDGNTVYVKKTSELEIGDVGIFSVNGSLYCKIYYIDDKRNLTLVSANPKMQESNIYVSANGDSSVVCFGKVLLDSPIPLPHHISDK